MPRTPQGRRYGSGSFPDSPLDSSIDDCYVMGHSRTDEEYEYEKNLNGGDLHDQDDD